MDEHKMEILPANSFTPVGIQAEGNQRSEKHQLFVQTLSEAQVDFLLQRTPKSEIKMRPGRGGMQFSYVEHGYVTERLNLVFGFNWDFEVVDKQMLEEEVIVEANLTVRTPGGQTIVKTQFGGAEIKRHASGAKNGKPLSIADDYKAAASDALKKCASLLGVGLDLYGRDRVDDVEPASEQEDGKPARGKVMPLGAQQPGLCTKAQIAAIAEAATRQGMTRQKLCARLNVSDLSELTEARAQRVLERLREMARLEGQEDAS
ncbi:MAG TPA: Rad52/Rad22 family DNA repair protein [Chloroflexia bacterium]|nr:Rad52/Rad22 family DNA repair protein [Chloroflexia bacterium]